MDTTTNSMPSDYVLIFAYKGAVYSFTDITGHVMDIEAILAQIDAGAVPSLPMELHAGRTD